MKIAKKTLSVFLSFLMIFGTCSVALTGFSFSAAAEEKTYTAADVKELVDKAIAKRSQSSSNNSWTYQNDDGTVLAAAVAVYEYARKLNTDPANQTVNEWVPSHKKGDTSFDSVPRYYNLNASNTLAAQVYSDAYSAQPNSTAQQFINNVLNPNGNAVAGFSKDGWSGYLNKTHSHNNGSDDFAQYADLTGHLSTSDYGTGVYDGNITKTSTVSVDRSAYLINNFKSNQIDEILETYDSGVSYTFAHTYTAYAWATAKTVKSGFLNINRSTAYAVQTWHYLNETLQPVEVSTDDTYGYKLQEWAEVFGAGKYLNETELVDLYDAAEAEGPDAVLKLYVDYEKAYQTYYDMKDYMNDGTFTEAVYNHFFESVLDKGDGWSAINSYLAALEKVAPLRITKAAMTNLKAAYDKGFYITDDEGEQVLPSLAELQELQSKVWSWRKIINTNEERYPALKPMETIKANYLNDFDYDAINAWIAELDKVIREYVLRDIHDRMLESARANSTYVQDPYNEEDIKDEVLQKIDADFVYWLERVKSYESEDFYGDVIDSDFWAEINPFIEKLGQKMAIRDVQRTYNKYQTWFFDRWNEDSYGARAYDDIVNDHDTGYQYLDEIYNQEKPRLLAELTEKYGDATVAQEIFDKLFEYGATGKSLMDYLTGGASYGLHEADNTPNSWFYFLLQNIAKPKADAMVETFNKYLEGKDINSIEINFNNYVNFNTLSGEFKAAEKFFTFCDEHGLFDLAAMQEKFDRIKEKLDAFKNSDPFGDGFKATDYFTDGPETYVIRHAGYQDGLGYANDIARDGKDEDYAVTKEKVHQTIVKLDGFVTSEDFCALLDLEDKDGNIYETLSAMIHGLIDKELYSDKLINKLVGGVFPMLTDTIETELVGMLADMGEKDENAATGAFVLDNMKAGPVTINGTLNLYLDRDRYSGGKDTHVEFPAMFSSIGLNIYPSTLAQSLAKSNPDKFYPGSVIYNALYTAGRDWSKVPVDDFEWGVTDKDSFIKTLGYILDAIRPLLLTLLVGADFNETAPDAAFAHTGKLSAKLAITLSTELGANADLILSIPGMQLYKEAWIPLMEALGISSVSGYTFKPLASDASTADIIDALFDPVLELIDKVSEAPLSTVLDILPSLVYILSMDLLQDFVDGLTIPLTVGANIKIDSKSSGVLGTIIGWIGNSTFLEGLTLTTQNLELGSMLTLRDILPFDYTNLNALISYVISMVGDGANIDLPRLNAAEVISAVTPHKDYSSQRPGGKRLYLEAHTEDVFFFIVKYLLEAVGTEGFIDSIITLIQGEDADPIELPEFVDKVIANLGENPKNALAALVELFVPNTDSKGNSVYETLSLDWYHLNNSVFDYDPENPQDSSIVYLKYNNKWTREKADDLLNNIDGIVDSILEMAGVTETGLNTLLKDTIYGLFTNKNITTVAKGLAGLGRSLDDKIIGIFKTEGVDIDLSVWYNSLGYLFPEIDEDSETKAPQPGDEKYVELGLSAETVTDAEGNNSLVWSINGATLEDGDSEVFVEIFKKLVAEFSPLISILLSGDDLELFGGAVTVPGYENYKNSVGLLLEILTTNVPELEDKITILSQAEFNELPSEEALGTIIDQLVTWLEYVLDGNTVKKIVSLLPRFTYFVESNGISTVLYNVLLPILVVIDDVRPILDVDLNGLASTVLSDLLNNLLNGEESEDGEKAKLIDVDRILAFLGGEALENPEGYVYYDINLKRITFSEIVRLADKLLGTDFYGSELVTKGLKGLCSGIIEINNSVLEEPAYGSDMKIADAFTIVITALLEAVQYETANGKTNGQILCEFIAEKTGNDKIPDIYNAAIKVISGLEPPHYNPNWTYYIDENTGKPSALATTVYLNYTTNWDEKAATAVEGYLEDVIATVVEDVENQDLRTLLDGILHDEVYTKKNLETIVELIVNAIAGDAGLNGTLRDVVDLVIDTNISDWFDMCDYNEEDGKYYVKEDYDWGSFDEANARDTFVKGLVKVVAPANELLSWLFFGTDYAFFTGGKMEDSHDMITLKGGKGYAYGLVPILEALGCTMGNADTDSGINPADFYKIEEGKYDVSAAFTDILNALLDRIDVISGKVVTEGLMLLPNVFFFINADGLKAAVNNLLAPVNVIIGELTPIVGDANGGKPSLGGLLEDTIGINIENLTMKTILDLVKGIEINGTHISFGEVDEEYGVSLLEAALMTFYLGEAKPFTSANGEPAYILGYDANDNVFRRDMLTLILCFAIDFFKVNRDLFTTLFDAEIFDSIIKLLGIREAKPMEKYKWYHTQYANTDKTFSPVDTTERYTASPYDEYWTKDKAQYVVENLPYVIGNVLHLLGLEVDGVSLDSLNTVMETFIDGNVYTQANADALLNLLKDALGKLSSLEPYDDVLVNAIRDIIGVDLRAWDDMTVEVIDGDRETFVAALAQILVPAAPLLDVILTGEDLTLFFNIEGAEAIVIPGSEGYGYGLIPVLEALKCDNILKPAQLKALLESDPEAAVKAVLNPLCDKIDSIKANPVDEILDILPSVIYFLNSEGVDVAFNNIVNSIDTVLAALKPVTGIDNIESLLGVELKDYTFNGLMTQLLGSVEESTGLTLAPLVINAVAELTIGKVVTYQSLNGAKEPYYTMKYASELDKADMLTVLLRLAVDFVKTDGNLEAIEELLKDAIPNEDTYNSVCSILESIAETAKDDPGMGKSLYLLYYVFVTLNESTEIMDDIYHDVNNSWQFILRMLSESNDPLLKAFGESLKGVLNKYFDGIFDDKGVASSGFITFFQKIAEFFRRIGDFFRRLFGMA